MPQETTPLTASLSSANEPKSSYLTVPAGGTFYLPAIVLATPRCSFVGYTAECRSLLLVSVWLES